MSCCAPKCHAFLDNTEYKCKGSIEKTGDLELYVAGSGKKCIIWNYDIYGFDGGRTRQNVDLLAEHDFMVILPDYYRGGCIAATDPGLGDFIKYYDYAKLEPDVNRVIAFAREKGAEIFGSVGTCWGSYLVMKYSSFPDFKAGISIHPSHSRMCGVLGETEESLLRNIICKQLFMPAGNDHENTRAGGLAEQILKDNLIIEDFPDMIHGWSTRGDLADPLIKRDVDRAVNCYLAFIKDNIQ